MTSAAPPPPHLPDAVALKGGARVSTGAWTGRTGGLAQHGSGEMEGNLSMACVDQATYDKLKVNNAVLFDQATYDKLLTEVPKCKQITPSVLFKRLRINGSLARRVIKDLIERGLIRMVSIHSSQQIPNNPPSMPMKYSNGLKLCGRCHRYRFGHGQLVFLRNGRKVKRVLKAQGQHLPLLQEQERRPLGITVILLLIFL